MSMLTLARSGDLREADLPSTYGEWPELARFAASFTPASSDAAAELGNWALARWRRTGDVPRTLAELRGCLWFEYRRWRFHDRVPDGETMRYCAALVHAMREHVVADTNW